MEAIRKLCTLRGYSSVCARFPLDGAVRRLALPKVLGKGGRMGEDHCGCNTRKYCEHTDAHCSRRRRRRRCLYRHRRNRWARTGGCVGEIEKGTKVFSSISAQTS